MKLQRTTFVLICVLLFASVSLAQVRRPLRAALYPYVPEMAEMYWMLEIEFEAKYTDIDLQFVDTSVNYYGGELADTLRDSKAEVVEIDTILLADLVAEGLLQELPTVLLPKDTFLPVADSASRIGEKVYGVPHWVCGNFLFFRADDPEADRFRDAKSLADIESILGNPLNASHALLIDLRGTSTLGEKYFDAVLDMLGAPDKALNYVEDGKPKEVVVEYLRRLFDLCPGGLCDSDFHHDFGEFYAREFAAGNARAMIGYSERMHFVVDHFLHGIREGSNAVGRISYDASYECVGELDVEVVSAPLADRGSTTLTWVDVLALRADLTEQQRQDALALIEFFNSEAFTASVLIPKWGRAPRYLLPARMSVYDHPKLLKAAPLYQQFKYIKMSGHSITGKNLNEKLRQIGKAIEADGF